MAGWDLQGGKTELQYPTVPNTAPRPAINSFPQCGKPTVIDQAPWYKGFCVKSPRGLWIKLVARVVLALAGLV